MQQISRRRFVQATAANSLALAAMGRAGAGLAQATRPNILFILADDLGFADVSCYGQRDYLTPNVDRLALEGLRFTQAYANSAVCSATRTALITGRYQYRLQVGLEEPINETTPRNIGLPPSHPTLPSLLRNAGYGTTLLGKWHLGFLPDFSPLKSGYDHFFGIFGGSADYFNHGADHARSGAEASELYEDEVPVERHGYMTNLLGDRAVETIAGFARSGQPFLLSLHFNAPHWPWEGPDDEAESKRISNIMHRDGGTQKTLKERRKDVFDRLKSDWEAWNAIMLAERPRPAAYGQRGNLLADHYGVTNPAVDPPPADPLPAAVPPASAAQR